jgi:hypothetical protein
MLDIEIARPDGWADNSMIAYKLKQMPASGVLPNFVVTQDEFGEDLPPSADRIGRYADRQLGVMRPQLRDFVVVMKRLENVAGRAAATLFVSWRAQASQITQAVTFVEKNATQVIIATATCASSDFGGLQKDFDRLLHTLQFAS